MFPSIAGFLLPHADSRTAMTYQQIDGTFGGISNYRQPRLVKLNEIGACCLQDQRFGVHGRSKIHDHRLFVMVILVLDLLAHSERAWRVVLGCLK